MMPHAILLRLATSGAQAALCLCAALAMTLLLAAGPADAKPRQLGVACSAAQLNKAAKCVKQQGDDIINGVPNPHFVACLADGSLWCCQKSTAGAGNNCTPARVVGPGDVMSPLGDATNAPPANAPATIAPSANGGLGGIGIFHKAQ